MHAAAVLDTFAARDASCCICALGPVLASDRGCDVSSGLDDRTVFGGKKPSGIDFGSGRPSPALLRLLRLALEWDLVVGHAEDLVESPDSTGKEFFVVSVIDCGCGCSVSVLLRFLGPVVGGDLVIGRAEGLVKSPDSTDKEFFVVSIIDCDCGCGCGCSVSVLLRFLGPVVEGDLVKARAGGLAGSTGSIGGGIGVAVPSSLKTLEQAN